MLRVRVLTRPEQKQAWLEVPPPKYTAFLPNLLENSPIVYEALYKDLTIVRPWADVERKIREREKLEGKGVSSFVLYVVRTLLKNDLPDRVRISLWTGFAELEDTDLLPIHERQVAKFFKELFEKVHSIHEAKEILNHYVVNSGNSHPIWALAVAHNVYHRLNGTEAHLIVPMGMKKDLPPHFKSLGINYRFE